MGYFNLFEFTTLITRHTLAPSRSRGRGNRCRGQIDKVCMGSFYPYFRMYLNEKSSCHFFSNQL